MSKENDESKQKGEENEEVKQAVNALSTIQDVADYVVRYANKLLGKDRAQQFYTQVSIMARNNPNLAKATPESLLSAVMACVHLDLMPNTPENLAHVIPYFNGGSKQFEANFQIGYPGLLDLARRSGEIVSVNAELVFEGDTFDVELGTERKLTHKPDLEVDRTDYKKVRFAYISAVLTNGQKIFHVMTRQQLDKIQATAKAQSTDAPWQKWPEEMAKKTVFINAAKIALPKSRKDNRLAKAAHFDNLASGGKLKVTDYGEIIEGETVDKETENELRVKRIKAAEKARDAKSNKKPKAVETEKEPENATA